MKRPFEGPVRITQEYGVRSTAYRKGYHTGVDYALNSGHAVIAPENGRVESGTDSSRGNFVIVYGDSGTSHHLYHLSRIIVRSGRVGEGQQVGAVGSTGQSQGPHLHWETRRAPFDGNSDYHPATWLFGPQQSAPAAPPPPKAKMVYLPAVHQWRLYNEGGPYTVGKEKAYLRPALFGGLAYQVLGNPVPNVVIIQTQQFGRGAIYVHPSTGAVIR